MQSLIILFSTAHKRQHLPFEFYLHFGIQYTVALCTPSVVFCKERKMYNTFQKYLFNLRKKKKFVENAHQIPSQYNI